MKNKFVRSGIALVVSSLIFVGCKGHDQETVPTPIGPHNENPVREEDVAKAIADQDCNLSTLKYQNGVYETTATYESDELTANIGYRISLSRDKNSVNIDHLLLSEKSIEVTKNSLNVSAKIATDSIDGQQVEKIKYPKDYSAPHSTLMVAKKLACKIEIDSDIDYTVSPTKYFLLTFFAGGTPVPAVHYFSFKEGRLICNGKDYGKGRIETHNYRSIAAVGVEGLQLSCNGQELGTTQTATLVDGTFVEKYNQRVTQVMSVKPVPKPNPTPEPAVN